MVPDHFNLTFKIMYTFLHLLSQEKLLLRFLLIILKKPQLLLHVSWNNKTCTNKRQPAFVMYIIPFRNKVPGDNLFQLQKTSLPMKLWSHQISDSDSEGWHLTIDKYM